MNEFLLRKATPEQLSAWGKRSQEIQMLDRLMREPPIYRPSTDFIGWITSMSFQLEQPVETKILLFKTNITNSYRAIVNGEKQNVRGGWHDWHEHSAKSMPTRILRV